MNENVLKGKAPEDPSVLALLTEGLPFLTDFLSEQYLTDFIPAGGSKIKFATGREGSGKSHFANEMRIKADSAGFLTAHFSAKDIWLHDFREVYLAILKECDIERVLSGCAAQIVRDMGYEPGDIPEGQTFMDYLSARHEADAISKSTIRGALRDMFIRNPMMDNSFALACSLLTGGILGYPILESGSREILIRYLHGDKTVKLPQLRALGLSPSRVTKFNARHLLRSLAETVHQGGYAGVFVVIDDMEMLLSRSTREPIHYSKLRREDTYESMRQLIDEIDSMHYIMFLLCFDRELMDDENYGIKSYQALWMRIQNEVVSTRFNRFSDILDLDRFADEYYTEELLLKMGERLEAYAVSEGVPCVHLDREKVKEIRHKAQFGGLGLPYLVNRTIIGGEENA